MSTSWSRPGAPARIVSGTAFGQPYERVEPDTPPPLEDVKVGLLTLVVTVLVGAPIGLLWAGFAPRVDVVVMGEDVNLTQAYGDAFIAADAFFLAAVLLAGFVGGLIAWRFGAAHGPAVVVALTVGGLAAAVVAMIVGEQVGLETLREAVRAGGQGSFQLNLELKATAALLGWPLASLVAYLSASSLPRSR
ncbi:MAG: DUF2567 domain-containing protein [Actinomycetota bacterium]|nr:DUF2567 domain-containing protein [Actinomycetota bacterium]